MYDNFRLIQQKEGFSSQQQFTAQKVQINVKQTLIKEQSAQKQLKKIQKNVQPAQQIKKKQYSLQPDISTGWKPKFYLPKPIPLIFNNDQIDFALQKLISIKTLKHENYEQNGLMTQLVYLGARHQSTYSAWHDKPFNFPYIHLNSDQRLKFTARQFCGQYKKAKSKEYLQFDSNFQSANLDAAFKVGSFQYDLFIRIDSNTKGHLQWFNFKVKNLYKGQVYRFNICNFTKGKSLYSRGMKPFIYSNKKYLFENIGWRQFGQNIKYQKNTPKSFKIAKFELQNKPIHLSFDYQSEYEDDQIQISYCIPYEYSKLKNYLQKLQQKCVGKNILKITSLCHSLGGLQIPLLTITSNIDLINLDKPAQKKLIFLSSRIHPGQSNGSHMIQGFIQFVCSDTQYAEELRKCVVFKIVPMVNPDGVVIGNYRTSLSGKDLNREFVRPDQDIFPEIYHLKKCVYTHCEIWKKDFLLYLDFHGHSTKKNCFTYGPQFSITSSNYYQSRIFPRLISLKTQMFRYFSCIFKISQCKQSTLRAILIKSFGLNLVYTIEVSNGSYYNHQLMDDVMFDQKKWRQMGEMIGQSIGQYNGILLELIRIKLRKKEERLRIKKMQSINRNRNHFAIQQKVTPSKSIARNTYSASKPSSSSMIFTQFDDLTPKKLKKKKDSHSKLTMQLKTQTQKTQYSPLQIFQFQDSSLNFLLQQIYSQSPNKRQSKELSQRSDDKISQGGSDSSGSNQDLDHQERYQLFNNIKKGIQRINNKELKMQNRSTRELKSVIKPKKLIQQQQQQQRDTFVTQMEDQDIDYDQLKKANKMSIKLFDLRSRKQIYLKKKSNQLITTPKKQQGLKPAKIKTFQFHIQPSKPVYHTWTQKQQQIPNSIKMPKHRSPHSQLISQSQQKTQSISRFKMTYLIPKQSQISSLLKTKNSLALRKSKDKKIMSNTFYRKIKVECNQFRDIAGLRVQGGRSRSVLEAKEHIK